MMPLSAISKLESDWKADVFAKAKDIDPQNKEDWFSLALGYALGKGMSPDKAHEFARYIVYNTDLA